MQARCLAPARKRAEGSWQADRGWTPGSRQREMPASDDAPTICQLYMPPMWRGRWDLALLLSE